MEPGWKDWFRRAHFLCLIICAILMIVYFAAAISCSRDSLHWGVHVPGVAALVTVLVIFASEVHRVYHDDKKVRHTTAPLSTNTDKTQE